MDWTDKSPTCREATLDNLTLSVERQGARWAAIVLRDGMTEWVADEMFEAPEQAQTAAEKRAERLANRVTGLPRRRTTQAERDVAAQRRGRR